MTIVLQYVNARFYCPFNFFQACMPAANLALDDVNRAKDLLPGFELKLHSNDSEVNIMQNLEIYILTN